MRCWSGVEPGMKGLRQPRQATRCTCPATGIDEQQAAMLSGIRRCVVHDVLGDDDAPIRGRRERAAAAACETGVEKAEGDHGDSLVIECSVDLPRPAGQWLPGS